MFSVLYWLLHLNTSRSRFISMSSDLNTNLNLADAQRERRPGLRTRNTKVVTNQTRHRRTHSQVVADRAAAEQAKAEEAEERLRRISRVAEVHHRLEKQMESVRVISSNNFNYSWTNSDCFVYIKDNHDTAMEKTIRRASARLATNNDAPASAVTSTESEQPRGGRQAPATKAATKATKATKSQGNLMGKGGKEYNITGISGD